MLATTSVAPARAPLEALRCRGTRGARRLTLRTVARATSLTTTGDARCGHADVGRRPRRGDSVVASGKSSSGGLPDIPGIPDADALMAKYAGDAGKAAARAVNKVVRPARRSYDGVFALLFINFALFACDHWAHLSFVKGLYLNHVRPEWWQFATSTFCHASWEHLSSNIFFLYIFGKLVEEEEGAFGVWMSYLVTGIGANLASWLVLPKSVGGVLGIGGAATVSLGASGAVFGLFAVSVLVKIKWDWKRILEVIILGQFVVDRFLTEAKMVASAGGGVGAGGVNHVAHLAGALVGVALILFLQKALPE